MYKVMALALASLYRVSVFSLLCVYFLCVVFVLFSDNWNENVFLISRMISDVFAIM